MNDISNVLTRLMKRYSRFCERGDVSSLQKEYAACWSKIAHEANWREVTTGNAQALMEWLPTRLKVAKMDPIDAVRFADLEYMIENVGQLDPIVETMSANLYSSQTLIGTVYVEVKSVRLLGFMRPTDG